MNTDNNSSEPIGNFDQPVLPVVRPESFRGVHSAIEGFFSTSRVADFLKSLSRKGLRIRDFESVLSKGLLGKTATAEYSKLGNADQGQIREYYLASLERVPAELRRRFFKLYSYY